MYVGLFGTGVCVGGGVGGGGKSYILSRGRMM